VLQASQTKPSLQKKKSVSVVNPSLTLTPTQYIPYIDRTSGVTKPYIEKIVNVDVDSYCGYRGVAESLGLGYDSYESACLPLIKEITGKKNDCLGGEDRLKFMIDSLNPLKEKTSIAPEKKRLTLPDMGHVIATLYGKVVVVL